MVFGSSRRRCSIVPVDSYDDDRTLGSERVQLCMTAGEGPGLRKPSAEGDRCPADGGPGRHPFFVVVKDSMASALVELDRRLVSSTGTHLLSRKTPKPAFGRTVSPGQVAIWSRNGRPIVAIQPGNYWNWSIRHKFHAISDLAVPIDALGLTAAQAGPSEAIVVQDPQNRVFVVRNGAGFAAYGMYGRFRIIAIVNMTSLGDECVVKDRHANRILGWKKDILTKSSDGRTLSTAATFLHIPPCRVAVMQNRHHMSILQPGQHFITEPSTTFRRFYSTSDQQMTFETLPSVTADGVTITFCITVRVRIVDPLQLAPHYDDAFDVIRNPAQAAVNDFVSRSTMTRFLHATYKRTSHQGEGDEGVVFWIDAFRQTCLDGLARCARPYGVQVESFDVLNHEIRPGIRALPATLMLPLHEKPWS